MTVPVFVLRTTKLSVQLVSAGPTPELVNRQLTATSEPGSQRVGGAVLRFATSRSGYGASVTANEMAVELLVSLLSAMLFCASTVTVTCSAPTLLVPSGKRTVSWRLRVP